jgi:hypothetical protein
MFEYLFLISVQATLDPAAVAEAQQRDDTATRAFSSVEIKVRILSPKCQPRRIFDKMTDLNR